MREQIMNLTKEITNEDLKEIIKEAIQEVQDKKNYSATLTIQGAAEYTGIGRDKIMELAHSNSDFPCFRVGAKFLINKDMLIEWLEKISLEKRVL